MLNSIFATVECKISELKNTPEKLTRNQCTDKEMERWRCEKAWGIGREQPKLEF